jgi:UDP-glucose 6-dehydrogenase
MQIAVFGIECVDFTTVCCLAQQGQDVTGSDVDSRKGDERRTGRPPIVEPGLADILRAGPAAGRIDIDASVGNRLSSCDLALMRAATPLAVDGSHNLSAIIHVTTESVSATVDRKSAPLTLAHGEADNTKRVERARCALKIAFANETRRNNLSIADTQEVSGIRQGVTDPVPFSANACAQGNIS